jgi:hypothetical protein
MTQPDSLEEQLMVLGVTAVCDPVGSPPETLDAIWKGIPGGLAGENDAGEATHGNRTAPD